jgi:hypothetical protein
MEASMKAKGGGMKDVALNRDLPVRGARDFLNPII